MCTVPGSADRRSLSLLRHDKSEVLARIPWLQDFTQSQVDCAGPFRGDRARISAGSVTNSYQPHPSPQPHHSKGELSFNPVAQRVRSTAPAAALCKRPPHWAGSTCDVFRRSRNPLGGTDRPQPHCRCGPPETPNRRVRRRDAVVHSEVMSRIPFASVRGRLQRCRPRIRVRTCCRATRFRHIRSRFRHSPASPRTCCAGVPVRTETLRRSTD